MKSGIYASSASWYFCVLVWTLSFIFKSWVCRLLDMMMLNVSPWVCLLSSLPRFAFSTLWEMTKSAKIVKTSFSKSIICSKVPSPVWATTDYWSYECHQHVECVQQNVFTWFTISGCADICWGTNAHWWPQQERWSNMWTSQIKRFGQDTEAKKKGQWVMLESHFVKLGC